MIWSPNHGLDRILVRIAVVRALLRVRRTISCLARFFAETIVGILSLYSITIRNSYYDILVTLSALTHRVHTLPRLIEREASPVYINRMVCTLGYIQRFTRLFALLTKLPTCGFLSQTTHLRAIVYTFCQKIYYSTIFQVTLLGTIFN